MKKVIQLENGSITIKGNDHWLELDYQIPEWNEDDEDPEMEACFQYRGNTYFLSEFMKIEKNSSDWMQDFDGHHGESYFSGILIKLAGSGDAVQVYSYYTS